MILDDIVKKTKERYSEKKDYKEIKNKAIKLDKGHHLFLEALKNPGLSFICEVKKASPSKGIIREEFPYLDIAKEYEKAGADAISCLTEPYYFKGEDKYLTEIKNSVSLPVLRKDFIISKYQIYESKIIGADAILLICAIISLKKLRAYLKIAYSLGLDVLVEAHNENEVKMALKANAKIIGINNRNLYDFTVDMSNSIRLRKYIKDQVFVSESGIKNRNDVKLLEENKCNAVLIGEQLMKSSNITKAFEEIKYDKS